jgi:hypothetical protein
MRNSPTISVPTPVNMRTGLDKIYVGLDTGIPGALFRVVLGILFVHAVGVVNPLASAWAMSAYFMAMLFAIKVFAAVSRRVVPVSQMVRSHWEWRRTLARNYDSHQWRKLLWFGIGIILGDAPRWAETTAQWFLGLACVAAGVAAEIVWRRHCLCIAPPA